MKPLLRPALLSLALPALAQDPDLESRILEVYRPGKVAPTNGPARPLHAQVGAPALALPRDAGSHPETTRERWLLRGVLQGPSGQRIPFQVTFQRRRFAEGGGTGAWSRSQMLSAQAALCLGSGRRILQAERRGRLGLVAEAATDRLALRCDGWSLLQGPGSDQVELSVSLPEGRMRLSFPLPDDPISLPGIDARDPMRRTLRPGLMAQGQLELSGQMPLELKGRASLLQEWGPDVDEGFPGWDQGLIQFRDGRTWVYLNERPPAGHTSSRALLVEVDAQGRLNRVQREPLISQRKTWQSSISGVRYPVALQFQSWNQIISLEPWADNQEQRTHWAAGSATWSGACKVKDGRGDDAADAFLELAGYAHSMRNRY